MLLGGLIYGAPVPLLHRLEVAEQVPASLPQPLGHPIRMRRAQAFLGHRPEQEAWKNLEGGGWEQSKSNLELLLEIKHPAPQSLDWLPGQRPSRLRSVFSKELKPWLLALGVGNALLAGGNTLRGTSSTGRVRCFVGAGGRVQKRTLS